jgi:hypothetical protein
MNINEIDRTSLSVVLEEKQKDGTIVFRAPALGLDDFTKNGRKYPRKVVEAALAKIAQVDGRTMYGSLGHKEKMEIPDVAVINDRLWIDDKANLLMVEGRILPNQKGNDLSAILKAGGKLGLSVKGAGSVKSVGEGRTEVTDDYRLLGIDFTMSPASPVATVNKSNLFESLEFEEIPSDGKTIGEQQEFIAKINETVQAGLTKVEKKIRPLVEAELKKTQIEAVELVDEAIRVAETKVRFVLNEAVRSKIVVMVEDKPELGHVKNLDDLSKDEKRNRAIVKEARLAGSKLSEEELLTPLKK